MSVFISYARKDRELVDLLARDIARAKYSVWLDQNLTGGQDWWDTVLVQIRECSLFVFVLSPESISSRPCLAEFRYASELGRQILPVMVRDVAVELAPQPIPRAHILDYRRRDADAAVDLINALAIADTPEAPLPTPLPEPPAIPFSYAVVLKAELDAGSLSLEQQQSILRELAPHLDDLEDAGVAQELLRELRRRPDIAESVAREIDQRLRLPPGVGELAPGRKRRRGGRERSPSTVRTDEVAPGSESPPAAVGGAGGVERPRRARVAALVAVLGAALVVGVVGAAIVLRAGGEDLADLDVGSVERKYEEIILDSAFVARDDIPPELCPLGDLVSLASVLDEAVPMSVADANNNAHVELFARTGDPDEFEGIQCSTEEEADGQLDFQVLAGGVGARQLEAALVDEGADEAGRYRNGRIMVLEFRPDEDNDRFCGSYWLNDDINVQFGVSFRGDGCTPEVARMALEAALPRMVRSFSSYEPPPRSGETPPTSAVSTSIPG